MKLKTTYSLQDMHVSRESDLPAYFSGAHDEQFILWMREVEHQGETVRQLCCDIISEVEPPTRAIDTLKALKENRLLLDDPVQDGLPQTSLSEGVIVNLEGNIKPNWSVDFDLLPKAAKDWFKTIKAEQSEKLTSFIKLLRWDKNTSGGHQPFSYVGTFWSLDGHKWNHSPSSFNVEFSQLRPIEASQTARFEISTITGSGVREPIYHDLMRDAAELADRAPRSALLVAFDHSFGLP